MNLSQALKTKSRLAGEIGRLQTIISRENSRRSDSVSKTNMEQVWKEYLETGNKLAELKGKIVVANIGLYPLLEKMSELKARITYINGLLKREGTEVVSGYGLKNEQVYTWESFITQEKADTMAVELQTQINDLQDQVDKYNQITNI